MPQNYHPGPSVRPNSPSPTTRGEILANLSTLSAKPQRSVAERMADIFVANEQDGRETTRTDLHREGFTDLEIDAEWNHACVKARKALADLETRDIGAAPRKTIDQVEQDIVDIISGQLPPAQILIAECQARGISKKHLDLLFNRARAKAALEYCHAAVGERH